MELLIRAYFTAFKRNVLHYIADRLTFQVFVQVDIGPDAVGLFCAVCGYLMDYCLFFGGSVENTGVVSDVIVTL